MGKHTAPRAIDAAAWLRERGLRATQGRIAIVRLLDASEVPLTLADIHEKVRAKGCDFATVFRFIAILEKKELVQRVAWIDGTTRHELAARDGHHHHHYLICRECHKVEPLDECVVESLRTRLRANAVMRTKPLAAALRRVSRMPEAGQVRQEARLSVSPA